jgi:hypothetical protein
MRELVGVVARRDLGPIFSEAVGQSAGRAVELIDLGAGPDLDIESCCRGNGVGYTAYDGNESFLELRRAQAQAAGWPDDPARRVFGRLEDMGALADAAYDLSFSRAATAWSTDPDAAIAEQLRITRRTAVFTEYDWTHAGVRGASVHSAVADAVAAGNAAKSAMTLVLESAGFKTEFGAALPHRVARLAGGAFSVTSVRHELPMADHRAIFFESAEAALSLLRVASEGRDAAKAQFVAERLAHYLRFVRAAPAGSLTFTLPTLVTVTAGVSGPTTADVGLRTAAAPYPSCPGAQDG